MKKKLLSPVELKEFRLQQEEQRRLRAAEIEKKRLEEEKRNKKLVSPKELLDPKPEPVEVKEEPVVVEEPKDPIEVLSERLEEIASGIKEPKYYDEELAKLEVLISTKVSIDEYNLEPINTKIQELRTYISELPEVKYYDDDLEKLVERVDELQVSGSEIFQQHGENLKEIKKVIHQMLEDLVKLDRREIPEAFDPTDIQTDIASTKETFYERVAELKKEISELPEVKYYDDDLNQLQERIESVRESIPEIPEIKYYDEDLENLLTLIAEVRSNIPEMPEVRYYENEIETLEEAIKDVESRIPTVPEVRYYEDDIDTLREEIKTVEGKIPELPEVKSYDEEVEVLSDDIDKVRDSLIDIKLAIKAVEKSVEVVEGREIPEAFDPTGLENDIEKAFKEIEKLKEQPVTVKEDADPLVPLDQQFVTFDELSKHYSLFINRIQQQLTSLGGGGETQLRYLDDIDRSSIIDGRVLSYDAATKKFKFISPGAASSLWNETVEGNLYKNANVGINSEDPQVALDVVGDANVTGVITATAFYGDGSNLTGVASTDSWDENGLNIYRNSNVGINSEDPQVALDVVGDANVTGVITATAFYGDGSNLTGVSTSIFSENVGINSEDPQVALDIIGDVSITGIVTVGTETITLDPTTNRITVDAPGGKQIVVDGNNELIRVGTGITIVGSGDAEFSGVVTATAFTGEFVANKDKTLQYYTSGISSGSLFRVTTSVGTKTFEYNNVGCLTTVIGTGVYVSKEFTYDGDGNLINVNVL